MKKTSYHVNPAVNKWEEEQRRARMEKMIQRAKSTLPPEARGGAKGSGAKKPSPYTAENNASKLVRKRSTTGGQGTPSGAIAVDAQELDSLIYNRVQEILHMPLMRRAAAAKAALKGGAPQRTPPSARGARRPAWNNDWNAQTASAPGGQEERPIRGAQPPRSGAATTAHERSPTKAASANARMYAAQGQTASPSKATPTKTTGSPGAPKRLDIPGSRTGGGALQRQPSGRTQGPGYPEERVVLLPSPSGPIPANRSGIPRPSSSRYGSSAGAVGSNGAEAQSGHLLEHSVVAAIEALNPQAGAAREAAGRIAHHQQTQRGQRTGPSPSGSPSSGHVPGGAAGVPASGSFRGSSDGGAATRLGGSTTSGGGAGQSLMATSQGGSPGMTSSSIAGGPGRPPLAPGVRASGRDGPHEDHHRGSEAKPHGSEDEYEDDDFEEYDGTDDEGGGAKEAGRHAEADEDGDGGDGEAPAVVGQAAALLRESVNALNGLVQLKIQQELARSHQSGQQDPAEYSRRSQADGASAGPGSGRSGPPAHLLASLALVGSEDPDARHGHRRGDPANSSLGDGLRQSDLDYLARLGAGEPHEGDVASSTDERFVIEPGAPAGTAKAWGDRHPWSTEKTGAGATGLEKLRARQDQEKAGRQQQGGPAESAGGGQRRSQAGAADERVSRQQAASRQEGGGGTGWGAAAGDEEDSVLLGETFTPRHRTGAVAQMAAVGDALTALASSGQLDVRDAKDLRAQTDALFGSLVQLHNLMTGPRGAELCSSSPKTARSGGGGGGAEGFSPMILSPIDSPDQSLKRPVEDGSPEIYGAADGAGRCRPKRMDVARAGEPEDVGGAERQPVDGALPGPRAGTHLQLTPKHRLVAEDVAWMAGLVHSLSKSLHVENGEVELPGV